MIIMVETINRIIERIVKMTPLVKLFLVLILLILAINPSSEEIDIPRKNIALLTNQVLLEVY